MTSGHVMMAMSLDGFVARKDHQLDWLMKQKTEGEDHGYDDFIASIDVIVMGSNSFRTVLSFGEWPYNKPVIVLSQQLKDTDVPAHLANKVEILNQSPSALMKTLNARNIKRAYIDGGAIVRSFLAEGHIATMHITIVPILIGDGVPLFDTLTQDIDLQLEKSKAFGSGLVDLHYRVLS